MQVVDNAISLAPNSGPASDSITNRPITHFIASESPASSPSIALSPTPVPFHSKLDGSNNVFDVRSNGAVGDGKTDDTKAFKVAWDLACNKTGQAKILVPKGSFLLNPTEFQGPCQNNLIFQVDGNIIAQEDPKSWPSGIDSWLVFNRVDGLTVQGGGFLDGKGENWWSCKSCNRPVALRFRTCKSLRLLGSGGSKLSVKNSPYFHVVIDQECQNVTVDSISIVSPSTSPNTDGIHIASKDIFISNSNISNGDDCISLANGSENIQIDNLDCRDGHGISIGSLGKDNSEETVKNISVTNCYITNSQNGVRIKTWATGSGLVSNVKFDHIDMNEVSNPIIIDQFYCPHNNCNNNNGNSELLISDVTYSNIKGTYNTGTPAVYLNCSKKMPCVNITIVDVQLEGKTTVSSVCENASGCLGEKIQPQVTGLGKGSSQFLDYLSKKGVICTNT
ncbi:Pectin lyase-like superfamily protein [Rhynchospora pubera]|uniref:Pectin lyase-like superfamily protein n=1 Tax=Rhynchospora pubera TaxID=906938 RepID=A0AAV8CR89_9POAL|nr:Pectin lyase-like superfamily protein [Rhynchospora pubera]